MMRLGGWSRLGIVISLIYAISLAIYGLNSLPRTVKSLHYDWFDEAAEVIGKAIYKAEKKEFEFPAAGNMRVYELMRESGVIGSSSGYIYIEDKTNWLEIIGGLSLKEHALYSREVERINRKYKDAIAAALPQKQREYWYSIFAMWLGGTIFLFVAGGIIGWVYKGFKGNAS